MNPGQNLISNLEARSQLGAIQVLLRGHALPAILEGGTGSTIGTVIQALLHAH